MIKEFRVKNFKNFKEELILKFDDVREYEFNLDIIKNGLINKMVVLGKNSTGKSNLGFALMDITTHLQDKSKIASDLNFLNLDSIEDYASFTYIFKFDEKEVEYHYKKNKQKELIFEEIKENGNVIFQYNFSNEKVVNKIDEIKSLNFTSATRNNKISMLKYINNNTIALEESSSIKQIVKFASNMLWFRSVRQFEFLHTDTSPENIGDFIIENNLLDALEKFLNDNDVNIKLELGINLGRKEIFAKYASGSLPLVNVASTGTMSLWLFFYWMNKLKDNISFLFIDEFDAYYHFDLSLKLLKYINSLNSFQSILTTHNLHLVSNLEMRPDTYYLIDNNKISSFANRSKKSIREAHNLAKLLAGGNFE